MARIRTVKPEFWDDEKIAGVTRDARLLYIALWNFSDDYGTVKGNPLWLKNNIFPYEDIKPALFKKWLDSLTTLDLLRPFVANGENYIYIKNFRDHQVINNPSKTRNPEPPTDILHEDYHRTTVGLPLGREGKGRERSTPPTPPEGGESGFEKFWKAYPRKKSKGQAEKAWQKIKPSKQLVETMLSTIQRARTSVEWMKDNGRFIPHPATWLNAKGWEDEYTRGANPRPSKVELRQQQADRKKQQAEIDADNTPEALAKKRENAKRVQAEIDRLARQKGAPQQTEGG